MIPMEVNPPDLALLQTNILFFTFSVKENRERYIKFELTLIHPFQILNDL